MNQAYTTTTINGTGAAKTTQLAGASNSTYLTFSGNEEISSGVKASFKIEPGISLNGPDTFGPTSNREAWVSLSGGFGNLQLGHQYSSMFWNVIGTDPNGFNNMAGATGVGASWGPAAILLAHEAALLGQYDTISYTLPTFIEGLGISAQSFRPTATTQGTSALVHYNNGSLYAGDSVRSLDADRATSAALTYDFGVAKIGYSSIDSTVGAEKSTDSTFSLSLPVSANVNLGFSTGTYKVDADKTNNSQFGAYYNLSKRTQLYALYSKASKTNTGTTETAIGINHSF